MKLNGHITITVIIGGIVYYFFRSFSAFLACLIGGILIDLDHFIDYYIQNGVNFDIKHFFSWCHGTHWDWIMLLCHSVELVFILWIVIYVYKLGMFWIGLAVGVSAHILLDIFFNRHLVHVWFYFLSYRLAKGFRKEYFAR